MGKVYKARERSGRIVAIKVLNDNQGIPTHRERFLREMEALHEMRGPGIVEILDQGSEGDMLYLVMEYLEGETLAERIQRGRLDPMEATSIMIEVAHAVARAHDLGIVHRDLKPENIFLPEAGGVKVLDFGISKFIKAEPLKAMTRTGEIFGTPFYMSLNVFEEGAKNADARDDAWALSAILYEMVAGSVAYPYPFDRIAELLRSRTSLPNRLDVFSDEIWAVISKGLSLDRQLQYPSAREFLVDLVAVMTSLQGMVHSQPTITPATQWVTRPPMPPAGDTVYAETTVVRRPIAPPPAPHIAEREPREHRQRWVGALVVALLLIVLVSGSVALLVSARGSVASSPQVPVSMDAGSDVTVAVDAGTDNAPTDTPSDTPRRRRRIHQRRDRGDMPTTPPMAPPLPIEPPAPAPISADPAQQRMCRETMVPNNTIARNLRNSACQFNQLERHNLCRLISQRGYIVDCNRQDDLRTEQICSEANVPLQKNPNCD